MHKTYKEPVDKLLTYGPCQNLGQWPDYLKLGFTGDHIQELIRMVTDESLHDALSDTIEVWAPTHAWRTLGQLRAEEAIEPLLSIFWMSEDDDWASEELPLVICMIGSKAIPYLSEYMGNTENGFTPRGMAAESLKLIAEMHPETRNECIKILTDQLAIYSKDDAELNGFIINHFIELESVDSIGIIEKAYKADCVDYFVNGDFEDVEIALGLKKARTKERDYHYVLEKQPRISAKAPKTVEAPKNKKKIGRNDPCPCGSGKKYKKCCLR